MNISADCINCVVQNQFKKLKNDDDENLKTQFMNKALKIIAECPKGLCSPDLVVELDDIFFDMFKRKKSFTHEKKLFNDILLEKEAMLWKMIENSSDKLKAGLLMSRIGNYIDFGVLSDVSGEKLDNLLSTAMEQKLDEREFNNIKRDLETAKNLVFLCDNAGEIVLDKLFLRALKEIYKDINIYAFVRGAMYKMMQQCRMLSMSGWIMK